MVPKQWKIKSLLTAKKGIYWIRITVQGERSERAKNGKMRQPGAGDNHLSKKQVKKEMTRGNISPDLSFSVFRTVHRRNKQKIRTRHR